MNSLSYRAQQCATPILKFIERFWSLVFALSAAIVDCSIMYVMLVGLLYKCEADPDHPIEPVLELYYDDESEPVSAELVLICHFEWEKLGSALRGAGTERFTNDKVTYGFSIFEWFFFGIALNFLGSFLSMLIFGIKMITEKSFWWCELYIILGLILHVVILIVATTDNIYPFANSDFIPVITAFVQCCGIGAPYFIVARNKSERKFKTSRRLSRLSAVYLKEPSQVQVLIDPVLNHNSNV